MCVPCLWELYYCLSLAMRRIECVKCAEGVRCSCWCVARGYVGAGVLLEENDSLYMPLVAGGRLLFLLYFSCACVMNRSSQ